MADENIPSIEILRAVKPARSMNLIFRSHNKKSQDEIDTLTFSAIDKWLVLDKKNNLGLGAYKFIETVSDELLGHQVFTDSKYFRGDVYKVRALVMYHINKNHLMFSSNNQDIRIFCFLLRDGMCLYDAIKLFKKKSVLTKIIKNRTLLNLSKKITTLLSEYEKNGQKDGDKFMDVVFYVKNALIPSDYKSFEDVLDLKILRLYHN